MKLMKTFHLQQFFVLPVACAFWQLDAACLLKALAFEGDMACVSLLFVNILSV